MNYSVYEPYLEKVKMYYKKAHTECMTQRIWRYDGQSDREVAGELDL